MTEANLFWIGVYGFGALIVLGFVVSIIAGFIRPDGDGVSGGDHGDRGG